MIGLVKTIKLYKAADDFFAYIKVASEQNQETVKVWKIQRFDIQINLRSSRLFTLRMKTFLFQWTNLIPTVWKKSTINHYHFFIFSGTSLGKILFKEMVPSRLIINLIENESKSKISSPSQI